MSRAFPMRVSAAGTSIGSCSGVSGPSLVPRAAAANSAEPSTMRKAGARNGESVGVTCSEETETPWEATNQATLLVLPIALMAKAALPPSVIARLRTRTESGMTARKRPSSTRSA